MPFGAISSALGLRGRSEAPQINYNPYDVTSGLGSAQFGDGSVTANLSPQFEQVSQGLLGQAGSLFNQSASPQATAGFLSQILGPEFQRQRLSQESRLQAQGLLGATAGQNRMRALSEAQNQSLLQGTLGAQQQFLQQGRGLLSDVLGLEQAPLQMAQLGGSLGQGDLQAQQFNAQSQMQADQARSNFFSSLLGAGIQGAATMFGGPAAGAAAGGVLQSVGGVGGATPRRF